MPTVTLTRRQGVQFVVCALGFALLVRVLLAMLYINYFDLEWYREWAIRFGDGFFDGYARLTEGKFALDYPPLYLYFLWAIGGLYRALPLMDYPAYDMLAMKIVPILFDCGAALMLYLCCRRDSEITAVLAACLWALNPSAIFNCAGWGQTDGMLAFFLLLAFYTVERGHPLAGSALFAVACLAKITALYFAPVLFFYLLRRWKLEKTMLCIGTALLTGVAAFVPFILGGWPLRGAASLLTPFEVYFGGAGKYPYAALNTYNLFGLFNLNWVYDGKALLFGTYNADWDMAVGGISLGLVSTLLLLGSVVLLAFVMLRGRREGSLWVGGFLFMQCLFLLTTRMHERYQFIVLPFAMMAYARLCNGRWLALYGSLTVVTFLNQFMLLMRNNTINDPAAPWAALFNPVQTGMSAVNLLLFTFCVYECCRFAFARTYAMPVYRVGMPPEKEETP